MAIKTPNRTVVEEQQSTVVENSVKIKNNTIVSSDEPSVESQVRNNLRSTDQVFGRKVYLDSTAQVDSNTVSIESARAGNVVAVYTAEDDVYVSNYEQNYTQQFTYTTETGVTQIIAGNNVIISSTGPNGSGTVTINALGEEALGTVSNVTTTGSGLGFLLYGGPITTTGTVALQVPSATALRTNIGIGNVANINLSGNGTQILSGNGTWISQPGATPPAGSNTQVQFNNSGAFGGSAGLTFTSSSNTLFVGNKVSTYIVESPVIGEDLVLQTAANTVAGGYAGSIVITAGSGNGVTGEGGDIVLDAGQGREGGQSGSIAIRAGQYLSALPGSDPVAAGELQLKGGQSTVGNTRAGVILMDGGQATGANGTGGAVYVRGGQATGSNSFSGNVYVQGGQSTGTNGSAGHVYVQGGQATSSPNRGNVYIGDANTTQVYIGNTSVTTTIAGGLSVALNANFNGITNFTSFAQNIGSLSGATGVVNHDFSVASLFNHTSIVSNFTVNVTNFNLASGKATNVVLILNQGAIAYVPSALQLGGVAQTINWQGGLAPDGNAMKKDIVSFSIYSIGASYTVFGQLIPFG